MSGFDITELRVQFLHTAERIARDPRALMPGQASLWRAGVLRRPTVCTGSANALAEQLRVQLRERGTLVAVVDDGRAGSMWRDVPVIASKDLGALRRRHSDLLLVNSAMMEAGHAHFARLAAVLGIDCVDSLQFHRLLREVDQSTLVVRDASEPLLLMDDPLAFMDFAVSQREQIVALEKVWGDQLSALTMYHLMLFRLTFDPVHLSRASIGGLKSPPGPGSYIFDSSLFSFGDDEFFVDGGAYRGDTFEHLFRASGGPPQGRVHAFEPDVVNMAYCRARALDLCGPDFERSIRLDARALWECEQQLSFKTMDYQERVGSHVTLQERAKPGDNVVSMVALDDVLEHPPTYIKLEVEGAETWALRGASQTICRHRPKLCVGIYHRPADLLHVAQMIAALDAGYQLYLRHHVPTDWGTTVCYGVPSRSS
ncbi:MAG: methyltransferase FkbM family [Myxococcaceae bacterium]|nr:methyltransferase FkbM family [Myxococcaceae bacterium]